MEEPLVTFPVAKLAKEKGFDVVTKEGFYYDGESTQYSSKHPTINIARPTQSLLQKWLREKKDIHCWVIKPFHTYLGVVNGKIVTKVNTVTEYTFEEALEIALEVTLKMIPNEKSNS